MWKKAFLAIQQPQKPLNTLRIGNNAFNNLIRSNHPDNKVTINNRSVVFQKCDYMYKPVPPKITFEGTENLVLDKCSNIFAYYWFDRKLFPDLKYVFMNCSPGGSNLYGRFYNDPEYKPFIFMSDKWEKQFNKYNRKNWTESFEEMELIPHDEMKAVLFNILFNAEELNSKH